MNVPALTGIRGVAALWVVLFHVQSISRSFVLPIGGWPILRDGWVGVDLFFILSGFILMLVHGAEFGSITLPALRRFAVLRVLRVYPLATVALLLVAALVLVSPGFSERYAGLANPPNLTASAFVRTLFLATRWYAPFDGDWNQPVWSLSVEIIGYCVFPVLAFAAVRLRHCGVLAAIVLACLVTPTLVAASRGQVYQNDILYGALVRMFSGFTAGVALGRLHLLAPRGAGMAQAVMGDLGLLLVFGMLLSPLRANFIAVPLGAVIYGIAGGRGIASAIFSSKPSMLLGRLSFPLYLIHVMPLTWLNYTLVTQHVDTAWRWVALAAYFAGCLVLSWVLHIAVERPSQLLAKRLVAVRPAAAPGGSGPPRPAETPRTPPSSG